MKILTSWIPGLGSGVIWLSVCISAAYSLHEIFFECYFSVLRLSIRYISLPCQISLSLSPILIHTLIHFFTWSPLDTIPLTLLSYTHQNFIIILFQITEFVKFIYSVVPLWWFIHNPLFLHTPPLPTLSQLHLSCVQNMSHTNLLHLLRDIHHAYKKT